MIGFGSAKLEAGEIAGGLKLANVRVYKRGSTSLSSAEDRFSTLLRSLADAESPELAQVAGRHLSGLLAKELPEYTGDFLHDLKESAQGPAWKREQAAEIAEILILRLYEPKNPISPGLRSASSRLLRNIRNRQSLLAVMVGSLSQLVILLAFSLLWPYGQIFKGMEAVFRLMEVSITNANFRASSGVERLPYLFEAAVYLVICVPLVILCIPLFILIGLIELIGKIG